jgi:hypothetical protein
LLRKELRKDDPSIALNGVKSGGGPIPNRIVKHSSGDDSPAARRDENTSRPEDLKAETDYLKSKERKVNEN